MVQSHHQAAEQTMRRLRSEYNPVPQEEAVPDTRDQDDAPSGQSLMQALCSQAALRSSPIQ